ncbi:MAG: helix-turn-helix transcriptional regulator [bacterium]|nr:helix-turn-helix transcriptional regulator [bacterium]MCS7308600.1 helix-turn-helix transcriptional regulator [Armatimonadota bacterium]MDW8105329.1 helix-turn-helix transcriptional regulator [Armatimonadota bacterium]
MADNTRDKHEPVYLISVAARLCDMHPQTLRMYERLGLIRPKRVNQKNRLYSEADIERLRQIQRLTRDLGVNLAGVEIILDLLDKVERLQQELDQMHAQMERMVQERVEQILAERQTLPARVLREL